ncbi:SDR family NAD(P)-dependent oxidoreductase [Croceicoccus sp. F390]|uniref:SDR family NAD(P)-dependent oxidoreductase n=1 Tax=Croceicoccus esteveae TaxID=3075597 RepID=A0ABU2ZKK1_9SPHN|nr:SDR family NAD(P)-dependent oxidoreductase [Croceicoccus sp. F390]MDT0577130.1 SDR family NAD(P)-dependent oxidoreductase [Croceicoccus sp. F390]
MKLHDQICIVTGAGGAGGIGEAIARRFVAEGARVVVCDIVEDKAQAVAADLGELAIPWRCDVTRSAEVEALVEAAVRRFGRLDVMVNNVGFTTPGLLGELDDQAWSDVLNGNLSSTFYGLRAALRPMRAQKSGSIINVGSAAGLGGAPGLGAYGAAKAGVINLTQTAAVENFKGGVRVNCILPNAATEPLLAWFEATEAGKRTRSEIEAYARCGAPEEIAAAAMFLASRDSSYVNGAVLPVDGGLCARVGCISAEIE